jgi:hypothetical protein
VLYIFCCYSLSHEFLITGDFNIHVDDLSDNYSQQFLSILSHANRTQHVSFPTHRPHHTLDLVITTAESSLSPVITHAPHFPSDQPRQLANLIILQYHLLIMSHYLQLHLLEILVSYSFFH